MQTIEASLRSFGLSFDQLIVNGKINRCHSDSSKKRNKNGWYCVREFKCQFYCNYGCWVTGQKGKCSTLNGSGVENVKIWKELESIRITEELILRKEGKARAKRFISMCQPAGSDHQYIIKKKIKPCGAMLCGRFLVTPLFDCHGDLSSYQTITEDGEKKMMYGPGLVSDCCFPIQGDEKNICICEGYATGATIHEATGFKVLCAMNAGNLPKIARIAVKQFPESRIIITADNDHTKDVNTGLIAGKKISEELGLPCVWPIDIVGSDFNDLAAEKSLDYVRREILELETIEVLTRDDCISEDSSLQIPSGIIADGLIAQGIEALDGDIMQYSLPLVLTVISRAIAGKISINGTHPNVFNVKVGGTSTGKTATDKKFLRCLDIENFISLNDIASGAGLWRAISDNPQGMGFFDEVTSLFQRNNNKGGVDMVAESKSNALLDVFSRSGETFKKGFGDSKNSIEIHNPCFSLIGNATPTIFEAIQLKDFDTGLMQRFDFWVYDGPIKQKPLLIGSDYFAKTKAFIHELRKRVNFMPPERSLGDLIRGCVDLKATPKALLYIKEYSSYITEEANKADSDGLIGFISRRFDLCLKYALIHHASVNKAKDLLSKITDIDIQYGIAVAEMLGGWKTNVLYDKVVSGDFHRDCEIFKAAIKANVRAGKDKPTFGLLASRRSQLKNWTPKYSESVITVLKKRGEIITKEGRKNTQYFLPKKAQNV